MSESYEPKPDDTDEPPHLEGEGVPPKTGGDLHRPGAQDAVDAGLGRPARSEEPGGMLGEG